MPTSKHYLSHKSGNCQPHLSKTELILHRMQETGYWTPITIIVSSQLRSRRYCTLTSLRLHKCQTGFVICNHMTLQATVSCWYIVFLPQNTWQCNFFWIFARAYQQILFLNITFNGPIELEEIPTALRSVLSVSREDPDLPPNNGPYKERAPVRHRHEANALGIAIDNVAGWYMVDNSLALTGWLHRGT